MNEDIKALIPIIVIVVIAVSLFVLLFMWAGEQHKIIENSNCSQLTQIIKDRGNDTPPRNDKVLSKWVGMECWK